MTTRRHLPDYCGARTRFTFSKASRLGPQWALQPKVDGAYAQVHLDDQGRIARILSRTGTEFSRDLVGHLLGAFVGWPHAVVVGELMAHTEAGNREAERAGARQVHLFDCIRGARGEYLARRPYSERYDTLWKMQSEVVALRPDRGWDLDRQGAAHDRRGLYTKPVPTGWRLTPVVPQMPAARFDEAWSTWVDMAGGEGLVAVSLDAPIGKGKRKLKQQVTIDAVVLSQDQRAVRMLWPAMGKVFMVGRRKAVDTAPGRWAEVLCDGFYGSDEPRFARLSRLRPDLSLARSETPAQT